MGHSVQLDINGSKRQVDAEPGTKLLEVIRNDLGLTGTKYGCGEGQCGSCTVLVDGAPVRSCKTTLAAVGSKPILTIESLEKDGKLHPLQQAFIDEFAMQCGFCVPGMILTALVLLKRTLSPNDEEISRQMQGNLCRCCNYTRIVAAIRTAAKSMESQAP